MRRRVQDGVGEVSATVGGELARFEEAFGKVSESLPLELGRLRSTVRNYVHTVRNGFRNYFGEIGRAPGEVSARIR